MYQCVNECDFIFHMCQSVEFPVKANSLLKKCQKWQKIVLAYDLDSECPLKSESMDSVKAHEL